MFDWLPYNTQVVLIGVLIPQRATRERVVLAVGEAVAVIVDVIADLVAPCTRIGVIAAELGLRCTTKDGGLFSPRRLGYQHF